MMNKLITKICMISMAILGAATVHAAEYIDVEQVDWNVGAFHTNDWQQTYVPGAENITAVSIYITSEGSGNVEVQILDTVCGTVLASGSTAASSLGWLKCNLDNAIALVPGNAYTIKVISDLNFGASNTNPYADGILWNFCAIWGTNQQYDLTFRTWADESAVAVDDLGWGTLKSQYR